MKIRDSASFFSFRRQKKMNGSKDLQSVNYHPPSTPTSSLSSSAEQISLAPNRRLKARTDEKDSIFFLANRFLLFEIKIKKSS